MSKKRAKQLAEQPELKLPPGVKLLRTFSGHESTVLSVAFDGTGRTLVSAGDDGTVMLWDVASGKLLRTLEGHKDSVWSVAFDGTGQTLASSGSERTVMLWDVASGKLLRTLEGHKDSVWNVAFDGTGQTLASSSYDGTIRLWDVAGGKPLRTLKEHKSAVFGIAFDGTGRTLVSGGDDGTVRLWDVAGGRLLRTLEGHAGRVYRVAFDGTGRTLVSGGEDGTVRLWDVASGRLLRTLEGHTDLVQSVAFSADNRLLASRSIDGNLFLWSCETWAIVAAVQTESEAIGITHLAFHPELPLLATSGSKPDARSVEGESLVQLWELDFDVLLKASTPPAPAMKAAYHTTAKIVLVGDSGVGKTGLGWRLAHGEYKEHSSTHGQQFWVVDELGTRREDGTECEAIIWDLAGQPDYRLTHALFLDDADLALVLFDPTDSRDPLHGVEFWLKQLKSGRRREGEEGKCCPTILVGARADRGEARLTPAELDEFCRLRGIDGGYLSTSAKEGVGLEELLRRMREQIAWEEKAATVTTVTFKKIKDYVLGLKENRRRRKLIVTPEDLRKRLEKTDRSWKFTDAEMMTAVGHLENYGYVRVLRTSKGEERVLLSPELLNNLAASFVLEARRNVRGLGSLEERRLLDGRYEFRELEKLSEEERDILLDSAALLFLEHNVCFRETDPLGGQSYLVFPELINLKKPVLADEQETEDGAAYTVSGAVGNVYASLVVLLGYTQTFTRTDQWQNQARYEVGGQLICGFRQEAEREGELDFVLYFGTNVGRPVRALFQGLFESFLARRNLTVRRFEPVVCPEGHTLNRSVVREHLRRGTPHAFCSECGAKTALPQADEPIQLTQSERREVDEQRWFAARRSLFEQAVFQVMTYVNGEKLKRPACFISYAWGDAGQERWVEKSLATDLQKAGIRVLLDRWENSRVGSSIMRFVEEIEECDYLIVVGTPLYRKKAKNVASAKGSVAAAEWELAGIRLLASEVEKKTVMPVLLAGEKSEAFPPLLRGRVFADFRDERAYFTTAFDLILSLYDIPFNHRAVADLRDSLRGPALR